MKYTPTGAQTPVLSLDKGDERGALCHSITHGDWEADTLEEGSDLGVESCSADDDLAELSSEPFRELSLYLTIDDVT